MEKTTLIQICRNTVKFPNLWGSIVPINILGFFCFYQIITGNAPNWWLITLLLGYFTIGILGIAIGYHRLFSHRSFKVHKITKKIILFLGVLAGQGSPIFWIGIHRGYHHRNSDKPNDAHSPKHGFWHSYILWMFKRDSTSLWGLAPRSIIDLLKDKDMIFYHKHYIKIFLSIHFIMAIIDINIWLYGLVFPTFIVLHLFCLQTSLTHYPNLGYKNFNTKDNSTNLPWLWPLLLGEAWHNNHHGEGRNPHFGGRRFWELDPAYYIILLIKTKKQ
jgi:stearoyl-CoA desaturase (delta-9 desaturase)